MNKNTQSGAIMMRFVLALLISFFSASSYAEQSIIEQAEGLHRAGKSVESYQLLITHNDEYAGTFRYDYLLGRVAIDAGEPLQAVFALERVLDQKPDFAPARAEIARAYFLIGENEAAKREFNEVRKVELPAGSRKLIDSYLSTIDERILGSVTDTSFYVAVGGGYDSNVNSATSTSQIAILNEIYSVDTPETDSNVAQLSTGGRYSHAIKQDLNFYTSADLKLYKALDKTIFSTQSADAVVGLHFMQGVNQYRMALVGQMFGLDGNRNRNLMGVNAQWQRTLDAANQITLFGQYASLRYPDLNLLDVNQLSVGATWLHVMKNDYHPVVYFAAYYGDEAEQTDVASSEYIGREYFGLRAGIRLKTSTSLLWSAVLSYQQSEYGGENPAFNVIREDDFINIVIGANYGFGDSWSLAPEISYSDNDSTLEINSYDRLRALITARKAF